jgi:hypothetical protein
MDTIDKVSSSSLKRVGWVAAVATLTLANAEVNEAILFANQTLQRGLSRIKKAGVEVIQALLNTKTDPKLKKTKELSKSLLETVQTYEDELKHIVWREEEAIKSVRRLASSADLDVFINDCSKEISTCRKKELAKVEKLLSFISKENKLKMSKKLEETENEKKARNIIPQRLFKGTLSTADVIRKEFAEKEYEWFEEMTKKDIDFEKKVKEMLNFMDGKRILNDIVKAVSAEYGEFKVEDALKFIRNMEKLKLVSILEK